MGDDLFSAMKPQWGDEATSSGGQEDSLEGAMAPQWEQRRIGETLPFMPAPKRAVAKGMHFISGALEPLYLPQQILFAAMSGDYSRLSWENIKRFAPGGAEPELQTGKDVLNRWGVEGTAATIGGLVLDFVADPILAGGYLKAIGTAAKSEKLIQLGKAADELAMFSHPVSAAYKVAPVVGRATVKGRPISDFVAKSIEWALEMPVPLFRRPVRASDSALPQTKHYTLGDLFFSMNPVTQKEYPWLLDSITEANGKIHALMSETKKVVEYHQERLASLGDDLLAKKTNEIVGKYLDKMGELTGKQVNPVMRLLDKQAKISKVRNVSAFESETRAIFEVAANRDKYLGELKRAWEISDKKVDFDTFLKTADDIAAKWFAHRVSIAHELTDYDTFASVLDKVSNGVPRGEALRAVSGYYIAKGYMEDVLRKAQKVPPKQRMDFATEAKYLQEVMDNTLKEHPWINDLEEALETEMPLFNNVRVGTYIRSLFDGYLRKVSTIHASDPDHLALLMAKLQDDAVMPFKALDEERTREFVSYLEKNVEDGNTRKAIENYVLSGANIIDVPEMGKWLREKFGIENGDSLAWSIGAVLDPEAEAKMKTLEAIKRVQDSTSRARQGDVYSLRLDQWIRDTADEAWNYLAEAEGVLERSQNLALSASVPIRAKDMFRAVHDELREAGRIFDEVEIGSRAGGRINIDGITYMALPKDPNWGALSGRYIPEIIWRELVVVSSAPSSGASELRRLLGLIRAGYISTAPAVGHNVVGNFALAYMRGLTPSAYIKYGKRASRILREAATNGFSRELEEAGFKLNFFHNTAAAREIGDILEAEMKVLASGKSARKGWREKGLGALNDMLVKVYEKLTMDPKFGGFLPWFQYAEDYVRTVAYLQARDAGMAKGLPKSWAVKEAVRYANDITFNYARLPRIVEFVRNTGFSLFPAFPYYMFQRTVESVAKNPKAVYQLDKIPVAINNATLSEQDRDKFRYGLIDYWIGKTRSAVFKRGEDYYFLPLDYVLPHTGVNAESWGDAINELISGGVYRPLVDIGHALLNEGRTTEYSSRFGRTEVFPPEASTAQKALGIGSYLVSSYGPGTAVRTVEPLVEKLIRAGGVPLTPEVATRAAKMSGKYLDLEPIQIIGQLVGFKPRRVGDATFYRVAQNIRRGWNDAKKRTIRKYRDRYSVLRARLAEARDPREREAIREELLQLQQEARGAVEKLADEFKAKEESFNAFERMR